MVQSDVGEVAYDAARVFEELGHRFEEVKTGLPELGYDWGLLGAFEMLGRLAPLLPEHEHEFGRAFLRGAQGRQAR